MILRKTAQAKAKESLLSICRAQLILCKNNASEGKESLLSICRAQLILCKGSKKLRVKDGGRIVFCKFAR